jgi:hypothetical protein
MHKVRLNFIYKQTNKTRYTYSWKEIRDNEHTTTMYVNGCNINVAVLRCSISFNNIATTDIYSPDTSTV